MAFIRRVCTASGATAVQIAEYAGGRQRIIQHVGSAHTEAELGVLLERARGPLIDPGQVMLDLDVEPAMPVAGLAAAWAEAALLENPGTSLPVLVTGRAGCGDRVASAVRIAGGRLRCPRVRRAGR